jgi:enoyl-CoA hydratase/carnithine racemase
MSQSQNVPAIKSFIEEHILHLIINRPEKKNCLNQEAVLFLTEKLVSAKNIPEVKVIMIYGEGNDSFSTGADLKELASLKEDAQIDNFFRAFARLIEVISRSEKPIITKISGHALAGSLGIVAASHISIASDDSVFALPEITKGLAPMVVMAPIAQCIGTKALAYLSLTGNFINAEEARNIGLISLVVKKEDLDSEAKKLSKLVGSRESTAIQSILEGLTITKSIDYFTSLNVLAQKISCLAKIQFR